MNTDLQAIMARRRRLADGSGGGKDDKKEEGAAAAAKPAPAAVPKQPGKPTTPAGGLKSPAPGAKSTVPAPSMGAKVPSFRSPVKAGPAAAAASSSNTKSASEMQAILERRRRLADGGGDSSSTTPGVAGAADESEGSMHGDDLSLSKSKSNLSHDSQGSYGAGQGSFSGSADMMSIMERRRRIADGEIAAPIAAAAVSPVRKPVVKTTSFSRGGSAITSTDPPGSPSKGASMSSDLQAIMNRRRKLADSKGSAGGGGGGGVGEGGGGADARSRRASLPGVASASGGDDSDGDDKDDDDAGGAVRNAAPRRASAFGRLSGRASPGEDEPTSPKPTISVMTASSAVAAAASVPSFSSSPLTAQKSPMLKGESPSPSFKASIPVGGEQSTMPPFLSQPANKPTSAPPFASSDNDDDDDDSSSDDSSEDERKKRAAAAAKIKERQEEKEQKAAMEMIQAQQQDEESESEKVQEEEPEPIANVDEDKSSSDEESSQEEAPNRKQEQKAAEVEEEEDGDEPSLVLSSTAVDLDKSIDGDDTSDDDNMSAEEVHRRIEKVSAEDAPVPEPFPPVPVEPPKERRSRTKKKPVAAAATLSIEGAAGGAASVSGDEASRASVESAGRRRARRRGSNDSDRRRTLRSSRSSENLCSGDESVTSTASGGKAHAAAGGGANSGGRRGARRQASIRGGGMERQKSSDSMSCDGLPLPRRRSIQSAGETDDRPALPTRQKSFEGDRTAALPGNAEPAPAADSFPNSDAAFPAAPGNSAFDFPAFGSGGDASGGDAFGAFGDAGGDAFGAFSGDSAAPAASGDAGFGGGGGFLSGFGDSTAPVFSAASFAATPSTDTFGAAGGGGFDPSSTFASAFATDNFDQDLFSAPPKKAEPRYDTAPLSGMPTRTSAKLRFTEKGMNVGRFLGSPTSNPLNGNIIFCSEGANKGILIREIDPSRDNVQVSCAVILSPELQRKTATKYNASVHSVSSVISLTAGLHISHGQTRLRVAAILDLRVLESSQPLRVVAVWQWGYGTPHPVALQFVMSPPSGGDFSYDAKSLLVADNLLFLAGASPKGPCVFISKPSVREAWASNSLGGSGRVSAMDVPSSPTRSFPYLAIALTDRSLSVWTYKEALGNPASKGSKDAATKRWLFPLCRLEPAKALAGVEASSLSPYEKTTGPDPKNSGHCTQVSWFPPRQAIDSFLLLATSFQNGLAIFHVALPTAIDATKKSHQPLPEPTATSSLAHAPRIWPLVAKRWQGKHEKSFATWVDVGPLVNPCLAMLFHSSDTPSARIALGIINFPLYRRGPLPKEKLIPFRVLSSTTVPKSSESYPVALLRSGRLDTVICHSTQRLFTMSMFLPSDPSRSSIASLRHPVASHPAGLASSGETFLPDSLSDKDGIFHIYSVAQCERIKSEGDKSLLEWSRPTRRYWICRTLTGDTKACGIEEAKEDKTASQFGDAEVIRGGAVSDVVHELYDDAIVGFVPFRMIRCQGSDVCAVFFRPSLCAKFGAREALSLDARLIGIVDSGKSGAAMEVLEARDVAFWPPDTEGNVRGLILSRDGLSLTYFTWDGSAKKCEMGMSYRPILGVDDDKKYVECRRVFAYGNATKIGIVVIGTRLRDMRSCVLSGDLCSLETLDTKKWSTILPNIVTGRCSWLEPNEEVFSLAGLEGDDSGYRNFALATSQRVIIVSSAMEISSQCKATVASSALAPLGAFVVGFVAEGKIRYLSCLDGSLASGSIATLPLPQYGYDASLLLAIRPDRFLLAQWHAGTRLVELGQKANSFLLPTATTRPAVLLEPMVANAVCVGGKQSQSTEILRMVVEKFGRKGASLTHRENEGIGNLGTGLTPRVFQILNTYGLKHAASWLLTGTVQFDRSASTTILPPWLPVAAKVKGALNSSAFLHLVAAGDQYFSDYVKSPDQGMASGLPQQGSPVSYLCRAYGREALEKGKPLDAIKALDVAGSETTDSDIVKIALLLGKDPSKDFMGILKQLSGYDLRANSSSSVPASLAALAVAQKLNGGAEQAMNAEQIKRWMCPLAPSLQRSRAGVRTRARLIGEQDLSKAGETKDEKPDSFWTSPCNESKHVWNEGPRKEKDKLLTLDRVDDWLGRRRPVVLGKEGAAAAGDRGAKTLADIMNTDEDSFGGKSDLESEKDGWVEGVGEGRSDESNLSGYFRFSEGDDEDSPWRSEGLVDLSPHQNKAIIFGDVEAFILQPSTSSVDVGDPGKVKSLFDLVFEKKNQGVLALKANRGSSLDVGMLHESSRQARQRCTIELWYYIPTKDAFSGELILIRRTMGASADDLSKVSAPSDKESMLWELTLKKSGELEFRTCGRTKILSSQKHVPAASKDDDSDEEKDPPHLAVFGRWNHVAISFSSRDLGATECDVTLYMKGEEVAQKKASLKPPGFDADDLSSSAALNDVMEKSHILLGLNNPAGLRLTEMRFWACSRSEEDMKSLMYEYLTAAEAKKKFKVKIKKKLGAMGALGTGKLVGAPQKGGAIGGLAPKGMLSLAPTPTKISLAPTPKKEDDNAGTTPTADAGGFDTNFNAFETPNKDAQQQQQEGGFPSEFAGQQDEEEVPVTLWDTALPLSQQVRSSAAAALIRGPPATRHFGGNRGGLPDFSGMERFGVGGIAICGSEKTIVWRDNEDPPALTYPIGASGAVVSDQMDDDGSEFLCCFLAKDKRMVVFELQSRTVVVELQMTTKLNFWRFLPPEACENTLCFMLVTPVGGFHWMPLDESPRPHQVWKRGPDLQGKKVVTYEEGGSNGLDGPDILSRVGLVMVTKASSGGGSLEAWIVPISGDSNAVQVSDDVMGGCLCLPPLADEGPFLPLLVAVLQIEEGIFVNVMSLFEKSRGSVELGEIAVTLEIDMAGFEDVNLEPPMLAMGTYPEAICCSLANIVVVIIRRKGLIIAFELEDGDMSLIAREGVGHYVIDAVMRYSAEVGGAEIVMLLSDDKNPKDGRMVSFCFRSAA